MPKFFTMKAAFLVLAGVIANPSVVLAQSNEIAAKTIAVSTNKSEKPAEPDDLIALEQKALAASDAANLAAMEATLAADDQAKAKQIADQKAKIAADQTRTSRAQVKDALAAWKAPDLTPDERKAARVLVKEALAVAEAADLAKQDAAEAQAVLTAAIATAIDKGGIATLKAKEAAAIEREFTAAKEAAALEQQRADAEKAAAAESAAANTQNAATDPNPEIELKSSDGFVAMKGVIISFDDALITIETPYGVVGIENAGIECIGAACPAELLKP